VGKPQVLLIAVFKIRYLGNEVGERRRQC
jgi:hypothetical protein